eukprot:gene242-biopygen6077
MLAGSTPAPLLSTAGPAVGLLCGGAGRLPPPPPSPPPPPPPPPLPPPPPRRPPAPPPAPAAQGAWRRPGLARVARRSGEGGGRERAGESSMAFIPQQRFSAVLDRCNLWYVFSFVITIGPCGAPQRVGESGRRSFFPQPSPPRQAPKWPAG